MFKGWVGQSFGFAHHPYLHPSCCHQVSASQPANCVAPQVAKAMGTHPSIKVRNKTPWIRWSSIWKPAQWSLLGFVEKQDMAHDCHKVAWTTNKHELNWSCLIKFLLNVNMMSKCTMMKSSNTCYGAAAVHYPMYSTHCVYYNMHAIINTWNMRLLLPRHLDSQGWWYSSNLTWTRLDTPTALWPFEASQSEGPCQSWCPLQPSFQGCRT